MQCNCGFLSASYNILWTFAGFQWCPAAVLQWSATVQRRPAAVLDRQSNRQTDNCLSVRLSVSLFVFFVFFTLFIVSLSAYHRKM